MINQLDMNGFPESGKPVLKTTRENIKVGKATVDGLNPLLATGFLYHTFDTGALSISTNLVNNFYSGDGYTYTNGSNGNVYLYTNLSNIATDIGNQSLLHSYYVPYIGAGADVNLGYYTLKSTTATSGNAGYDTPSATQFTVSYYPIDQSSCYGTYSAGSGNYYDGNDGYLYDTVSYAQIAQIDYTNGYVDTTGFYADTIYDIYYTYSVGGDESYLSYNGSKFSNGITIASGNILDANSVNSIDPNSRYLYNASGNQIADWSLNTYTYGFYVTSLQTDNIFSANNTSVSFGSGGDGDIYLRDIYASNGSAGLKDPVSVTSLNWASRQLYDSNAALSIDYTVRGLYDSSAYLSVDYTGRQLYDGFNPQILSVDWGTRILYDSLGTTPMVNWSTVDNGTQFNVGGTNTVNLANATYALETVGPCYLTNGGVPRIRFFNGGDTASFYDDTHDVILSNGGSAAWLSDDVNLTSVFICSGTRAIDVAYGTTYLDNATIYTDGAGTITVVSLTETTPTLLKLDQSTPQTVTGGMPTFSGGISVDGKYIGKITTVTDTYNILETDQTVVCNKATAFTVTLPTAVVGQVFNIKNIGAGTVTVDGTSTDLIDDVQTQDVEQWENLTVQCYAANKWAII